MREASGERQGGRAIGPRWRVGLLALAAASLAGAPAAHAAEGLWTFDDAPAGEVRATLGVRLDSAWLSHLQRASVRLTSGCSGAVVSNEGLVLTSEHCLTACEESLSRPGEDLIEAGFLAATRAEERACPGLEAEILISISDVTGEVFAASAGRFGADYVAARQSALVAAEQRICGADPALRCQIISFFSGGEFKVYKYRSYKDVRLAFAPEFAAALFGGDLDNFVFPRFDLDAAFLRLYEGGKPAATPDFLAWSHAPPEAGEAVFMAGNPGATERHLTAEQLRTLRDAALPIALLQRSELRGRLIVFSEESPEHRRVALHPLFEEENALKILRGREAALRSSGVIAAREKQESELKARLAVEPALAAQTGDPWAEVAGLQSAYRDDYAVWRQLEASAGAGSQLFAWARTLVRGTAERARPVAERLPDFAPSRLPLIEKVLLDPKPLSADLERLMLEFWLSKTRETLGADSPAVAAVLGKEDPAALAARLVAQTRLSDPAVRRRLWQGGAPAVAASQDPLIVWVAAIDPVCRAARRLWEEEVVGPSDRAAERIERIRLAAHDGALYPEATFSLRLSYGRVSGALRSGREGGAFTTFAGLFGRVTGAPPFALPPRWQAARPAIDPAAVLDFTASTDILPGGSGSPLVNVRGEIVGTAFDGNLASIAGDYAYDGDDGRTIAVSTVAVGEVLAKVYGAKDLIAELQGRSPKSGL